MSTFEAKVKVFLAEVNNGAYEVPSEMHPQLRDALVKAGFDKQVSVSSAPVSSGSASSGAKKGKTLNGYNLYMKEKMAELKEQGVASGDRMGKVSTMWKTETAETKEAWKNKAKAHNGGVSPSDSTVTTASAASAAPSEKKAKGLSGYQLFVQRKMTEVKEDKSVEAKDRMKKIGEKWKALSEAEKEQFNKDANEKNVANGKPVTKSKKSPAPASAPAAAGPTPADTASAPAKDAAPAPAATTAPAKVAVKAK